MKKLLLISLSAVFLAACSPKPSEAVTTETAQQPVQAAVVLPNLNGQQWDFNATAQQKPVFVAFMATFCGFCKKMAPHVEEIAQAYKDKNAEVAIVFVDETADVPAQVAKALQLNTVKVHYNGGAFAQNSGVTGFPQMFLFDKDGNIIEQWSGYNPDYVPAIKTAIDNAIAARA